MTDIVARRVNDFCATYGVGRSTAYKLMRTGVLEFRRVGDRNLILEASARAWFDAQPASAPTYQPAMRRAQKRTQADEAGVKSVPNQRVR